MSILKSLSKAFLSFRFIPLAGIAWGLWLFSMQTEMKPISSLLTEGRVYLISFMIVVCVNLFLWVFVEKGSLYDIGGYFIRVFRDTVVINWVMLSTIALSFLIHTFL
jgi:hypothetical protein